MRYRAIGLVIGLLACGDPAAGTGTAGVLNELRLVNTAGGFQVGDDYVFTEHWQAFDEQGTRMEMDSNFVIGYSLGDSLAPTAAIDGDSLFTFHTPFSGNLYVFAPTGRAAMERLGQQFIQVTDTTGF